MPNSFWIVMGVAVFLIWGVPRWLHVRVHEEESNHSKAQSVPMKVQFYGGPLDGVAQEVERDSDFFVAPYLPRTDEGEIDMDEAKIAGQQGDRVLFEANLAYYQQIMPDSYFYVRDISKQEIEKIHNGYRPTAFNEEDTL